MPYDTNPPRTTVYLIAILLVAFSSLTVGAGEPVVPNAGSILRQVELEIMLDTLPGRTDLKIERKNETKLPSSVPFSLKTIEITGNTLFDTATLHALVADAEGQQVILTQLGELSGRITDYYQSHNYPLARAIIPAQTIQLGVVRIEVLEANYGERRINNRSLVDTKLLEATLSTLTNGQAIGQIELDHALLLLSDIPGVLVTATLKPGEAAGTSDLLVTTLPGPAYTGNTVLENYGNGSTGKVVAGATVNFINPLKHGDTLTVSARTSGIGMNYGRVSYESLLNGQGTRLGGAYSQLSYALTESFASLNAHGTAHVKNVWARHPLVRSGIGETFSDISLHWQIKYAGKQLRDHIDITSTKTDRNLDDWTLTLDGNARDGFLSGGVTSWNLGWTSGQVQFDDSAAQLVDANSANTQGNFSKLNLSLYRLQNLNPGNRLKVAFSGQLASTNLDSSQSMGAGGPNAVRAYDTNAVSGDSGHLISIELQHNLDVGFGGQWQAVAFVDSAEVTVNKTPWVAGTNAAALHGAGLGINVTGENQWNAKAYVAVPIGAQPALVSSTQSARAWVSLGWNF